MTTPPLPRRPPADVAAAQAALARPCRVCGHPYAAHAPDGCRTCQILQGRGLGEPCTGWSPADLSGRSATAVIVDDPAGSALGDIRRLNLGPVGQGNAHQLGIEDTAALTCSTPTGAGPCGHRADAHRHDPAADSGLGACTADGCGCFDWTYALPDDEPLPLGEVEVAADTIADQMATAIGGAEDDDDTTRRVLAVLRANRAGLEVILAADDVVDAEVLDPVGDAIRAVLEPYVGATWTGDAVAASTIALVSALERQADDVADYLGLRARWVAGAELNADRVQALARAIAGATDRYNGEGTAVLAALLRDGWRLERTAPGMQVG